MKKEYYFTSGEVVLHLHKSIVVSAETREEAEDILVERVREYGEVYRFSTSGEETSRTRVIPVAPVETCPY